MPPSHCVRPSTDCATTRSLRAFTAFMSTLHRAGLHAPVGGVARHVRGACAGHQGLGRHAAVVDAGAAEVFTLDQHGVQAGVGQSRGEEGAGLAAADDDRITARGHGLSPDGRRAWLRGRPPPGHAQRARIVEVIESTTLLALANCSPRSVMPWRLAIQPKSVYAAQTVPVLVLQHEQAHRPVEPGVGVGGQELRAQRRVAEGQQRRGPQRDAGVPGELRLVDGLEEQDALGLDVAADARDRLVDRVGAAHLDQPVGAGGGLGHRGRRGDERRAEREGRGATLKIVSSWCGPRSRAHITCASICASPGNRSTEISTAGVPPVFFHQCEVPFFSGATSPARCTIGTAQLLAYSTTSPETM